MPNELLFWDVDTQVDFIDPEGKLAVPGADAIVPSLARLTDCAREHQVLIVASADAHRSGDEEFSQFPPHCILGTRGQQKIPQTSVPDPLIIPNAKLSFMPDPAIYAQVVIEKQHLDVFTNPNTDELLASLGSGREIVLYGVVTEICVSYAARGLLDRGHRVHLVTDAMRHLDQAKSEAFVEDAVQRGAGLVTVNDVIKMVRDRSTTASAH